MALAEVSIVEGPDLRDAVCPRILTELETYAQVAPWSRPKHALLLPLEIERTMSYYQKPSEPPRQSIPEDGSS